MAWETRGKRKYFYRKERINGKVKSVYVGSGEVATLIAECERGRQIERKIKSRIEQNRKDEAAAVDAAIDEFSELNRSLVDALFLVNGFHQHDRHWRKKRNEKK